MGGRGVTHPTGKFGVASCEVAKLVCGLHVRRLVYWGLFSLSWHFFRGEGHNSRWLVAALFDFQARGT